MNRYVLDTHTIIWFLLDDRRLSDKAKKIIHQTKALGSLIIPTIVLGELAVVVEKGRVKGDLELLIKSIKNDPRFIIMPFDIEAFENYLVQNKNLEIHDRIIVATAKILKAHLVSKDKIISKYYKKTIW